MTGDLFSPAPELFVSIEGPPCARRHFRAEYGPALVSAAPRRPCARASMTFGGADGANPPGEADRHKSVRWTVAVGEPDADTLTVRVALGGWPRGFALSLVQGFVVEPLVSVAAARAGLVLLPAAAIVTGDEAVILLGPSGAGKTSLVARALAAGRSALGDDQIVVGRHGGVWSWPRRLRVYPDLRATAPAAARSLRRGRRAALAALAVLRIATRGWVAPSLPLRWSELGAEPTAGPVRATRVVVVERGGISAELAAEPLTADAVTTVASELLREQRGRFAAVAGPRWSAALAETERRERELLASALAPMSAERWRLPAAWPAPRAVAALAERLGV